MKKIIIGCLFFVAANLNAAKKQVEAIINQGTAAKIEDLGRKPEQEPMNSVVESKVEPTREERVMAILTTSTDTGVLLKVATEESKAVQAEMKTEQAKVKPTTLWEKFKQQTGLSSVLDWANKYRSQITAFGTGVVITLLAALKYANSKNRELRDVENKLDDFKQGVTAIIANEYSKKTIEELQDVIDKRKGKGSLLMSQEVYDYEVQSLEKLLSDKKEMKAFREQHGTEDISKIRSR